MLTNAFAFKKKPYDTFWLSIIPIRTQSSRTAIFIAWPTEIDWVNKYPPSDKNRHIDSVHWFCMHTEAHTHSDKQGMKLSAWHLSLYQVVLCYSPVSKDLEVLSTSEFRRHVTTSHTIYRLANWVASSFYSPYWFYVSPLFSLLLQSVYASIFHVMCKNSVTCAFITF